MKGDPALPVAFLHVLRYTISLSRPSKLGLRMQDKLDMFVKEHNKLHLESRLNYLEQQVSSYASSASCCSQ